jgi:hypothetical protein
MEQVKNNLLGILQFLFDVINRQGVVRRAVLGVTVYMTYTATIWAQHFAQTTERSGVDVAAIIGAVTAPLMALQGYAFKHYLNSRQEDGK